MTKNRFEVDSFSHDGKHYVNGPWELLPGAELPENIDPEHGISFDHYYDASTTASRYNLRIGRGGI